VLGADAVAAAEAAIGELRLLILIATFSDWLIWLSAAAAELFGQTAAPAKPLACVPLK